MSASDREIEVRSDNPAAELLVVDSDFKLVAKGSPPLRVKVQPGIYSLKAKVGEALTERLEIIEAGDSLRELVVPAPAARPSARNLDTRRRAELEDKRLEVSHADACELVVWVLQPHESGTRGNDAASDPFEQAADRSPPELTRRWSAEALAAFSILDRAGEPLLVLGESSTVIAQDGGALVHVRVPTGTYTVAQNRADGQLCFTLAAVAGWRTQVQFVLRPTIGDPSVLQPDFADAAVVLERLSSSTPVPARDLEVLEAVRLALQGGRNVVGGSMMRDVLRGKFADPMLGLYAGHILLSEKLSNAAQSDWPLIETVLLNTGALIGFEQPDVLALLWTFSKLSGKPAPGLTLSWDKALRVLAGPPMLAQSWDMLLDCAEHNLEGAIDRLPAFFPAGNIVASGIWLTWKRPPAFAGEGEAKAHVPAAGSPASSVVMGAVTTRVATAQKYAAKGVLAGAIAMAHTLIPTAEWVGRLARGAFGKSPQSDSTSAQEHAAADIDTTEDAARTLKTLAGKLPWPAVGELLDDDLKYFGLSGLQRDLIIVLMRVCEDPSLLASIDADYISAMLRTHRVPLSTLSRALKVLDRVANAVSHTQHLKLRSEALDDAARSIDRLHP